MPRKALSFVLGLAALAAAVAILAVGYIWTLLAWSGGEYAQPPPSLGQKIGQALPVAVATLVLAAILAIAGVFLISIARRDHPRFPPGSTPAS